MSGRNVRSPFVPFRLWWLRASFLPDTLCRLESASPLLVLELLGELLSTPPSRGRKWLTDTCSMKEVPYFLKYHHSKIWEMKAKKGGQFITMNQTVISTQKKISKLSLTLKLYLVTKTSMRKNWKKVNLVFCWPIFSWEKQLTKQTQMQSRRQLTQHHLSFFFLTTTLLLQFHQASLTRPVVKAQVCAYAPFTNYQLLLKLLLISGSICFIVSSLLGHKVWEEFRWRCIHLLLHMFKCNPIQKHLLCSAEFGLHGSFTLPMEVIWTGFKHSKLLIVTVIKAF